MLFLRVFVPLLIFSSFIKPAYVQNRDPAFVDVIVENDTIKNFSKTFYPKFKKKEQVIRHLGYTFCYDENFEQAKWVAYRLTAAMCNGNDEERTDNFREDPSVKTGSASPDDYKKTGYDRGHLCPAGDMAWSEITMSESFYMSNMSPQEPKFNRGIWKTLESQVREWAKKEGELYIVTAGVLEKGLKTIGEKNKVAVPKYYYKIILDVYGPEKKAIAFIMPNEGSKESIFDYAVTIDSVEKLTQINFFPSLPDDIENNLESHINVELWK
ncbi:DNA/RNA non-specific endonuclease [soil metagenome]